MGKTVVWPVKFKWVEHDNQWHVIDARDDTQICEVYHCKRMREKSGDNLGLEDKTKEHPGTITINIF